MRNKFLWVLIWIGMIACYLAGFLPELVYCNNLKRDNYAKDQIIESHIKREQDLQNRIGVICNDLQPEPNACFGFDSPQE